MRRPVLSTITLLALTGCGPGGEAGAGGERVAPVVLESSVSSASPATTVTVTSGSATGPPTAEARVETSDEDPPSSSPSFEARVTVVDDTNREMVASTWRPECPVALGVLRLVELSHWDFEGRSVTGALVVHVDHVDDVIEIFERLHDIAFPIERMTLIDTFGGDDDASMAANNTSAFNCRAISGASGVWSQHAYGGAIDLNPLVNPWVRGDRVDPPAGARYAERFQGEPGMIDPGDPVTQIFSEAGWGWGGDWADSKDYQHFSWNGK